MLEALALIGIIAVGTAVGDFASVYLRAMFMMYAVNKQRKQQLSMLDEFEKQHPEAVEAGHGEGPIG